MSKNICKRDSNFELLRIIAMIMIIAGHYVWYGGLLHIDEFNLNQFIACFLEIGGKLGVTCFALISGYFMCKKDFRIERIIRSVMQIIFYSGGGYYNCFYF